MEVGLLFFHFQQNQIVCIYGVGEGEGESEGGREARPAQFSNRKLKENTYFLNKYKLSCVILLVKNADKRNFFTKYVRVWCVVSARQNYWFGMCLHLTLLVIHFDEMAFHLIIIISLRIAVLSLTL